jgi:hypothetical protein
MVSRTLRRGEDSLDLEAAEKAIREMGKRVGRSLLEKLLNIEIGSEPGLIACGSGHMAKQRELRSKQITTVLGPVTLQRAYYYCGQCGDGVIPRDRELDVVSTSLSPGVRRMIGRVGGKEPFDEGRRDLEELAGVRVSTKAVERASEAIGEDIEVGNCRDIELSMSNKVVPITNNRERVSRMYIAMDGTQVPTVPSETAGRKGRGEEGEAKTREARLGCVFTQTTVDPRGEPVRDERSTTYVGAIESAEQFGLRVYSEAVRRGVLEADEVVVLGDAAFWIWTIADLHFHGEIQIIDLYHALEHLSLVAKTVHPVMDKKTKRWLEMRYAQLKGGDIEALVRSLKRLRPEDTDAEKVVAREIDYFVKNRERMRYGEFRRKGLFIGSGVVEAGCKTVIGRRLGQSGMRWTVRGANAIIALRCCQLSGRWEDYWEARSA